jgi:hypothetical protein
MPAGRSTSPTISTVEGTVKQNATADAFLALLTDGQRVVEEGEAMGTVLYTADGEALYAHEGYVSAVLDDGSSTHGTWTLHDEERTVGWRAECSCGWAGSVHKCWDGRRFPTDAQYDTVLADWNTTHGRPLATAQERTWQLGALADGVLLAVSQLKEGIARSRERGASWDEIAGAIHVGADQAERIFNVPNGHTATTPPESNRIGRTGR